MKGTHGRKWHDPNCRAILLQSLERKDLSSLDDWCYNDSIVNQRKDLYTSLSWHWKKGLECFNRPQILTGMLSTPGSKGRNKNITYKSQIFTTCAKVMGNHSKLCVLTGNIINLLWVHETLDRNPAKIGSHFRPPSIYQGAIGFDDKWIHSQNRLKKFKTRNILLEWLWNWISNAGRVNSNLRMDKILAQQIWHSKIGELCHV